MCFAITIEQLFSLQGKLAGRAIYFACVNFFIIFLNDRSENNSQDPLDRFSQSFHRMKAFWVQMIDLDLFFRYLKGHCHGNQFCEKNGILSSFIVLTFRNGMGYRYLNVLINSVNDACSPCTSCSISSFDFCCFRAMTQQSILHLVVNWEVFTTNVEKIDQYTQHI